MDDRTGILERNKDQARRVTAAINSGDTSEMDEIVAVDFVEHALAPFGREAPGAVHGPRHMRETVAWLLAQFPDLRMSIDAIVADDDLVAVLLTAAGTNLGPLNGVIAPTGRAFAGRQSHWYRVWDGRLVEHWATRDDLGAMLQLGVIPVPGADPV
jgi:predicted ester cyclase